MNITMFELEDWQKEIVSKELQGHNVRFIDDSLHEEHISKIQDTEILGVFIYSQCPRSTLERLPNLKMVATMSTGFDHIDLAYCKEKGIVVCNVPTYGENTVAEFAMALGICLTRKMYQSIQRTKESNQFITDRSLRGQDLREKTMGLIGCGNIGKHLARMAKGFGMHVMVFDLHKDEELAKEIGFVYANSFDELLGASDLISIHVPYNAHTHHLVNAETIAKMKKGVIIINTARGGVIDTHALVQGLQSGKVGGAGLDVLEYEGEIKEEGAYLKVDHQSAEELQRMLEGHYLMNNDNVIVTPHNAFNSWEALGRILSTTLDNMNSFSYGHPKNVVNK